MKTFRWPPPIWPTPTKPPAEEDGPSRRDLAGAVAGAGLLAIAGACLAKPEAQAIVLLLPSDPAHPDAALFAALAHYELVDQHLEVLVDEQGPLRCRDPRYYALDGKIDAQNVLLDEAADEICSIVPATLAGHAARAATVLRRSARYGGDCVRAMEHAPYGVVYAIMEQLAYVDVEAGRYIED